jgi:hypothetical protein
MMQTKHFDRTKYIIGKMSRETHGCIPPSAKMATPVSFHTSGFTNVLCNITVDAEMKRVTDRSKVWDHSSVIELCNEVQVSVPDEGRCGEKVPQLRGLPVPPHSRGVHYA